MNEELFLKVKKLNLPLGQYVIFGSGPMGIRNLRKCNDMDIVVIDNVFEEYKKKSDWEYEKQEKWERIIEALTKDDIEMYKKWGPGEWNRNELISSAEIIDELPFVKLNYVIKWKKISGREKDLNDIKLIQNYLKRNI